MDVVIDLNPIPSFLSSLWYSLQRDNSPEAELFLKPPSLSVLPQKDNLFGEVCQFSHLFCLWLHWNIVYKCYSLSGSGQIHKTESRSSFKLSKSCYVLFSYDEDDDMDNTTCTVEERLL